MSDTNPKAPEGAIAIPEDLREQYDLHKKWLAIPWHERPRGTASVEAILRENAVNDIERIAALTVRAEQAEAKVARLSAPINLAEVRAIYGDNYVDTDDDAVMAHVGFAEIIRMARLAAPEPRKEPQ